MKLNVAQRKVETNNLGATSGFAIKAGGKAFRVIIDGMYSDKPQSITREIWSNAFDAHSMVGKKDQPFKVSFPTNLDSNFRCRDYGPGMDHEFMMNRYTVAFDSTKEDTNDAVGFLGIGRLSPFAYTDTYSVTVWRGGVATYYSVYLTDGGMPNISMMGYEPSSEPDGTEVSFAVDRKDLDAFRKAAMRVSLGFDVKPICSQSTFEGWPELEARIEGDGWFTFPLNTWAREQPLKDGVYAKMGCVIYPIQVPEEYEQVCHHLNMVIEFNIGDLAVTASRESLSYGRGEPTADSVKKMLKSFKENICDIVQKDIDTATCEYDARHIMYNANSLSYGILRELNNTVTWRGKKFGHHVRFEDNISASELSMYQITRRKHLVFNSTRYISCEKPDVTIVLDDCRKGKRAVRANKRIRRWYTDNRDDLEDRKVVWFQVNEDNYKDTMKLIGEAFQDYDLVKPEDLEDVPPVGVARGQRKPVMVKDIKNRDIQLDDTEFDDGGFYVPLHSNIPVGGHAHYQSMSLFLHRAGNKSRVILVPATLRKKFDNADQWVTLRSAFDKEVNKLGRDRVIKHSLKHYRQFTNYHTLPRLPVSGASKLIDLHNRYMTNSSDPLPNTEIDPKTAMIVAEVYGLHTRTDKIKRIQDRTKLRLKKSILDRYPLIKYVSVRNDAESAIKEYIELINREKGYE